MRSARRRGLRRREKRTTPTSVRILAIIAEQLGIVLNAEGGDPLARMAGLMFSEVPSNTPPEGVGCSDVEREEEGLEEEEEEEEEEDEDDYDDDDDGEQEEEGKSDLGLAADYHSRRRRRKKPSFYRRCFRKTALSTSSPSDSRPTGAAFPSSVAQLGGSSGRNGGSDGSGAAVGRGAEEGGGSTGLGEGNAGSGGVGSGGETQYSQGSLVLVKAKTNPGVDPRL
jgi:hypothetical protein